MDFLIEHGPFGKPADHARWRVAPRNLACEGGGNNSVVQQNPTEATADMPQFGVPERIYRLGGTREGMVIASHLSSGRRLLKSPSPSTLSPVLHLPGNARHALAVALNERIAELTSPVVVFDQAARSIPCHLFPQRADRLAIFRYRCFE